MSKAPVCLIQPVINTQQPSQVDMPSIPQATDLASAIAAINALAASFRTIQSRLPPPPPTPQGQGTILTSTKKKPKQGRWNRIQQTVQTVRVFNSQDKSQYVDVEQITGLTMQDSLTGEQWIWSR